NYAAATTARLNRTGSCANAGSVLAKDQDILVNNVRHVGAWISVGPDARPGAVPDFFAFEAPTQRAVTLRDDGRRVNVLTPLVSIPQNQREVAAWPEHAQHLGAYLVQ